MGWTKALFSRLTMWSSNPESSSSSSSSYPPVFAVDRTEVTVVASSTTGVPELTLRELNKATGSFSASRLIGRGSNATVYRASLSPPIGPQQSAVAKLLGRRPPSRSRDTWTAADDEFLRRQVVLFSRLRHHSIVRLLGYTIDAAANVRALLFEFADMGTLHDALHGTCRPALSWAQRAGIALEVARGLEYLHDAAATSHWGVSSTNVLLFQGLRAKIADYDLFVRRRPQDVEELGWNVCLTEKGGSWYLPPESIQVMDCRAGPKFDVYSYGVVLLELLTGRARCDDTPYLQKLLQRVAPLVREGRVEQFMDPKLGTQYPADRALKLATIALCCVQESPRSRPSMGEVAETIHCYIVSSAERETSMHEPSS